MTDLSFAKLQSVCHDRDSHLSLETCQWLFYNHASWGHKTGDNDKQVRWDGKWCDVSWNEGCDRRTDLEFLLKLFAFTLNECSWKRHKTTFSFSYK